MNTSVNVTVLLRAGLAQRATNVVDGAAPAESGEDVPIALEDLFEEQGDPLFLLKRPASSLDDQRSLVVGFVEADVRC